MKYLILLALIFKMNLLHAESPSPYFDWLRVGKIIEQHYNTGELSAISFFYVREGAMPILVNGSITATEDILSAQSLTNEDLRKVLEANAPSFFVTVFGQNGRLIDNTCVNTYRRYAESAEFSKLVKGQITDEMLNELRAFASAKETKFKQNSWILTFCSFTDEGSVEKWLVGGTLSPFTIISIERRVIKRPGSIPSLPEIR